MNLVILTISIIVISSFVGTALAQQGQIIQLEPRQFSQEEIDLMKNKAVVLLTNKGQFTIELFPEDAPNHVHNFLQLVESGFYEGVVFHRIIPGFMIQSGDPLTKDSDRSLWGTGGSGYQINEEFNTIKHVKGIVSMARGQHQDSASSQFFIVHRDTPSLDGEYTAFGRLIPGTGSMHALEIITELETNDRDAPINPQDATIIKASILDPYFSPADEPARHDSIVKQKKVSGGWLDYYSNNVHDVEFNLPYRWAVQEFPGANLDLVIEPTMMEHSVQKAIEKSGFIPQILVKSDNRKSWEIENNETNTGFFSIRQAGDHTMLSNYMFMSPDGTKAHFMVTTQDLQKEDETIQFKIAQIHFNSPQKNYSIIYVNTSDWFRYETNAFRAVVDDFTIPVDGEKQKISFGDSPIFKQVMKDADAAPEPEPLPPARIGGCLIATAAFDSEMAPQIQSLREIRDNTVLQTESGAAFMTNFNQFYYSFSPTIADYERENSVFKEAVKVTLTPLLTSLTLLQYVDIDSEQEMLGYGIGLILLNIGMYFIAPAVLITKIRSFYKLQ